MEINISNIIEQVPVGIITFSLDGKIDFVNRNLEKFGILYQLETPSLLGANIFKTDIFPSASITEELKELKEGFSFEKEISEVRTNDGGRITLIVKGAPLYQEEKVSGGILLIEDIKILTYLSNQHELRADYIEKAIRRVNDFLIVTNQKGEIKFSAGSAPEKLNITQPSIIGKSLTELFSSSVQNSLTESIAKVTKTKEPLKLNLELNISDKQYTFECRIEPLLSKRGTIQFIYFFFNDITSEAVEKSRQDRLVSELDYYRSVTSNLSNALFTLDNKGNIIFWDDEAVILFGHTAEEMKGRFFGEALKLFNEDYFKKILKDLKQQKVWEINVNIFGKDQVKQTFELKFSFADEKREAIIVLCNNITERFEEDEKIKSSEKKLKNIVANTGQLICSVDQSGKMIYANSTFLKVLDYNEEEITGKNISALLSPSFIENNSLDLNELSKQKSQSISLPFLTKEKKQVPTLAVINSFFDVDTKENGFNFFITDISTEKSAEKEFQFYQSLFEVSQDGLAVETDGKIVKANNSFAEIFGYDSGNELVGRDLIDLVSNDDVLKVVEYFRLLERKKNAPDRFEFLGKKRDNSFIYTELSVSTFESDNKVYVVMVTRDVTERKRAQKVIRESEEKYRNVTENIDDFLYTFERVGNFMRPLFYTSSVEKVTGYSQADFLGDSKLFLKIIHPDDFPMLKKRLSALIRSRFQLSAEMEVRIINKQGGAVWIRNKVKLIRDEAGKIQKIYGLVSDITLKKRAEEELKKSTENLLKLNETKDRFISIISHDLRTPFSSILGFTELLASDETLSKEERSQYINFIKESSTSMLSLVNSLLDWTRLQTGRVKFEPQKIQVKTIIEKSINSLSGMSFQKGISVSSTVGNEYFVFVDQHLINQVFNNLLSNAIKFTSRDDNVTVSVKPSGTVRFLEFSVKDTGRGIKQENINKLFSVDTKFTSEGTSGEKGSGLGLSLVKDIVEKHDGKIWVESEYGKGSDFKFTLPTASASILIVDDNKTDRLLYSKILNNITPEYNVEVVSNGKEALEKISISPPALVITEHKMPEMNGYEFVQELIKANPASTLPVLVLSRKVERNVAQDYLELGIEFVFQKPVNLQSFKKSIEKSLRKGISGNNSI
ncbi:MAG: PAS domain S-box protein [Ignavibacteriaceae bacterium]